MELETPTTLTGKDTYNSWILECKYCKQHFKPRRKGHLYCSSKCSMSRFTKDNPRKELLRRAQYRAKRKGYDFDLSLEDIPEIPTHCPILGIPIENKIGSGSGNHHDSLSLNRKDCKKGYVKDNIEIISNRANTLLSDATIDELEKVLAHAKRLV